MKIGFIGQGFVGKNIADDFERRGYSTIRYALEPQYALNRKYIADCDVVFVAVPTPTIPEGFDYSIVEEVLTLVGDGKIVVLKSTLIPGTTKRLQDMYRHKTLLFSPEFLSESSAVYDAAHPAFNIIGIPFDSMSHLRAAQRVQQILPQCDHNFIIPAHTAELFKYTHNIHGYLRVVFANMLHDLGLTFNVNWSDLKAIMDVDPMMSPYYNAPVHQGGRGAGGHCFVKDMAAFARFYAEQLPHDPTGNAVLKAMEQKNLEYLRASGKSQDLVRDVYGSTVTDRYEHDRPRTDGV